MYARISLEMQKQFDSKHALALYELFKDYLIDARNYGETPFIPLTTFHKLLGISESYYSKSFKKLNQDVIKPAIKEINAKRLAGKPLTFDLK